MIIFQNQFVIRMEIKVMNPKTQFVFLIEIKVMNPKNREL